MVTAMLNTKKATSKAAKAENKAVLRKRQIQRAAGLLKQVSDPTRLQIVLMLAEKERYVGAICEVMNQSQPATSHHLALLRHGGIIAARRQGKNNFYSLTDSGERHVGALREVLEHSQPATSHHLALLRHGGIIAPRRQGKNNFYALTEPGERLASIVKNIVG